MAVEAFLATRPQRLFIATILIQAIVVLVLIGVVFRSVAESVAFTGLFKTIPCYLALFALAAIFEVLMTLDALYMRNIIQLFGILVFHLGLIIAAAVQVRETELAFTEDPNCQGQCNLGTLNTIKPLLIVSPCIIAASWILLCYFFKELYAEFGWAIFHVVGANPKMKKMYQHYQILICLLKFDFFAFTGVTMQLLIVVLQSNSTEFGLTIVAMPVVLILLILCGIAVQREVKWIMYISLALMLASESYFVYKLVRFYAPSSSFEYKSTRVTLTVFSIISLLLILTSFYFGLRCLLDFDKGLLDSKMHITPRRRPGHSQKNSSDVNGTPQEYQNGAPLTHRISIE